MRWATAHCTVLTSQTLKKRQRGQEREGGRGTLSVLEMIGLADAQDLNFTGPAGKCH